MPAASTLATPSRGGDPRRACRSRNRARECESLGSRRLAGPSDGRGRRALARPGRAGIRQDYPPSQAALARLQERTGRLAGRGALRAVRGRPRAREWIPRTWRCRWNSAADSRRISKRGASAGWPGNPLDERPACGACAWAAGLRGRRARLRPAGDGGLRLPSLGGGNGVPGWPGLRKNDADRAWTSPGICLRWRQGRLPESVIPGRMRRTPRRSYSRRFPISIGPASISCAAADSSSGRSRAASPACASRSARAFAAPRLERATLIVPDVHRFPGHIACDAASNSEIVVPLVDRRPPDRRARRRQPPPRPLHAGRRASSSSRSREKIVAASRLAACRHRRLLRRGRTFSRDRGKGTVPFDVTSRGRCRRRCAYRP